MVSTTRPKIESPRITSRPIFIPRVNSRAVKSRSNPRFSQALALTVMTAGPRMIAKFTAILKALINILLSEAHLSQNPVRMR